MQKNEVRCSYVAQNVEWKKIVGRKVQNGTSRREISYRTW